MDTRRSQLWLFPVLVVTCLLTQPAELEGQCVVMTTYAPVSIPPTISVTKVLSAAGMCTRTMQMNNLGCFPTVPGMTTAFLIAGASTGATNPSCGWLCTCGGVPTNISTGPGDGLPVELMDFSIEGEELAEGARDSNPGS